MTQNERIRKLLREAPSTCREIADVLRIPMRAVQVGMWVLQAGGHARPTGGTVVDSEGRRGHHGELKLYELTEKGRSTQPLPKRERPPIMPQADRRAEYLREVGRAEDGA